MFSYDREIGALGSSSSSSSSSSLERMRMINLQQSRSRFIIPGGNQLRVPPQDNVNDGGQAIMTPIRNNSNSDGMRRPPLHVDMDDDPTGQGDQVAEPELVDQLNSHVDRGVDSRVTAIATVVSAGSPSIKGVATSYTSTMRSATKVSMDGGGADRRTMTWHVMAA